MDKNNTTIIIELIKDKLISIAEDSFREAAISGLCMDGAIEAAIGAMKSAKIEFDNQISN
ncbi:acetyltransferase [bacterium]|nr:MAG: acetyltransferase [bacterium]